jgi:hypothetical protein
MSGTKKLFTIFLLIMIIIHVINYVYENVFLLGLPFPHFKNIG